MLNKDFISATEELAGLGYEEVNINIGCPSGTVISKGKGAGFLGDLDGLDGFLMKYLIKHMINII